MTKEEFYKLLEEHGKGKFAVGSFQRTIRTTDGSFQCPICFLCEKLKNKSFINMSYPEAAKLLDLDYGVMNVIVDAADQPKSPSRQELLKVLGL